MYVGKRLERPNLQSLDNPLHLLSHSRPTNDDIDVSVLPPNQMTIITLGPTSGYSLVGVVRQLTVLPLCLQLILLPGYLASMVALLPGNLGFEPGPSVLCHNFFRPFRSRLLKSDSSDHSEHFQDSLLLRWIPMIKTREVGGVGTRVWALLLLN